MIVVVMQVGVQQEESALVSCLLACLEIPIKVIFVNYSCKQNIETLPCDSFAWALPFLAVVAAVMTTL